MNFENPGKGQEIYDAAKMECGMCWHVYDPAEGDSVRQNAAGTPFSTLPEDWRRPNCDAAPAKYMRRADG